MFQAVNHPYLVVYSKTNAISCGSIADSDNNNKQVCGICHEPAEEPVVSFFGVTRSFGESPLSLPFLYHCSAV